MKRKVIALMITAALILTLVPATALAADSNNDGYNDNDYGKIKSFLETVYDGVKNGDRVNINYKEDDPTTWAVHWTDGSEKYVKAINWANKAIGGALDLSGCTQLVSLDVSNNRLTSLDVSGGMAVYSSVGCGGNGTGFTALNVDKCSGLVTLYCDADGLSTLDLRSLTGLEDLKVDSNKLGTLDVTNSINLKSLTCDNNQLTSLDVTNKTNLSNLECNNNHLTSLDLTGDKNLAGLDCSANQLTSLDISQNTALVNVKCNDNKLTSLDIAKNTALTNVDCSRNQLSALDISKNINLQVINLDNNRLSTLDATNNNTDLTCDNNLLTDIKAKFDEATIQLNAGYGGYLSLYLETIDDSGKNDKITATAKSSSGAPFINWTNADKSQASTNSSYSLSPSGTYQLTANFLALQPSPASGKLYVGDKITLTPTVPGGEWSFDSANFTRNGNTFTALKAGTSTVTYTLSGKSASFDTAITGLSNISASANDAALGSVSGAGAYRPDATLSLQATANTGCHFVRWTENGAEVSTNPNYSFKVTGDRTLVAVFAKDDQVGVSCSKTDVSKYGGSDGSITVTASGGNSGNFQYSINNGASWQSSGSFTGLTAGTYTVLARDAANTANVSAAVSVTINQVNPTAYFANKLPAKANAGAVWLIKPVKAPKGFTFKSASFASGNNSVASVDASGIVSFLKGGKAKLTVKMVFQKGTKTKTVKAVKNIVVNQKIVSITLNNTNANLQLKKSMKLVPTFGPASATNKTVKWKSSNSKVVTVSAKGVIKGKARGTAVITCTAKDGSNVSVSCTVTVY